MRNLKNWDVVISQSGENDPHVDYEQNDLGFVPSLTRNGDGLYTINLSAADPSTEERLFVTSNTLLSYSGGSVVSSTVAEVNDVDGEIIIKNHVNGSLTDGFTKFHLQVRLKRA